MPNLIKAFEHHFRMKQRGAIPYQTGFIIVGKLPHKRRTDTGPSLANKALASITPALAEVERVNELVGGNGQSRKQPTSKAPTHRRAGTKSKQSTPKSSASSKRPRKEAI